MLETYAFMFAAAALILASILSDVLLDTGRSEERVLAQYAGEISASLKTNPDPVMYM